MTIFQKVRDFFVGSPPDEVVIGQFVDQPKDYPVEDPRTLLPEDHIDYIKPEAKP